MISVFHNDQFIDYFFKKNLTGNTVRKVAEVATTHLNAAFRFTNHIDTDWTLAHPEMVKPVQSDGTSRSTSVGDLMILDDKCYVVEAAGFRVLSQEELATITFKG